MASTVRIKERSKMEWRYDGTCTQLNRDIKESTLTDARKLELIHALTEQFYPTRHSSLEDIRNAKRICVDCPVRTECLAYSIVYWEKMGIWGGRTEIERRNIRRHARNEKVKDADLPAWLNDAYPVTKVVHAILRNDMTEAEADDIEPDVLPQ